MVDRSLVSAWSMVARQRTAAFVAVDEQIENGEIADRRNWRSWRSNRAMILAWPVRGAVKAPQAGEPTILKVAFSA